MCLQAVRKLFGYRTRTPYTLVPSVYERYTLCCTLVCNSHSGTYVWNPTAQKCVCYYYTLSVQIYITLMCDKTTHFVCCGFYFCKIIIFCYLLIHLYHNLSFNLLCSTMIDFTCCVQGPLTPVITAH